MIITGVLYRKLHRALVTCYDLSDLKMLSAMIGIAPEAVVIQGITIDQAVTALIEYCTRRAIESSLIESVIEDRPGHPAVKELEEAVLLTGESTIERLSPVSGRARQVLKSIGSAAPQGVVTILFSDIEGYSSFSQRMDERAVHELVNQHNGIIRDRINRHSGHEVKTLGDGFMVAFSSPCDGVLCSLSIQNEFNLWNAAHRHQPIWVRIGLNIGEVISAERGDYEGDAVNAAARIAAQAKGGQVLISDKVKLLCEDKLAISFLDLGPRPLKGFAKDFNLFAIDWHRRTEA